MKTLIGINGKKRAGKTTAGEILSELTDYKTYAFADPLKTICHGFFDLSYEEEEKEKTQKISVENWKSKILKLSRENLHNTILHVSDTDFCSLFYKKVILPVLFSENEKEEKLTVNISPRKSYQLYGTEFIRSINKEIWIELALLKYKLENNLIITDVRYDNEAEFIKNNNGLVINIFRNTDNVDSHPSEFGISKSLIDVRIDNNGSIEELINSLGLIVEYHIKDPIISLNDLL